MKHINKKKMVKILGSISQVVGGIYGGLFIATIFIESLYIPSGLAGIRQMVYDFAGLLVILTVVFVVWICVSVMENKYRHHRTHSGSREESGR